MFASASSGSRRSERLAPRKDCLDAWPAGPASLPDHQPMNDATPTDMQSSNGAPSRASGSSFYTAMRILPRAQREAMFEIYSFCRLVDDVADSTAPHAQRRQQLAQWRADIEAGVAGEPRGELRALARTAQEISLRKKGFLRVIDGMDMDAAEDIRAPQWTTLDLYCDRVASAVGRLSVRIFGMEEQAGIALSHHLGRALQLTNILRDLDEDAEIGRLYLPREELSAAGIVSADPAAVLAHPELAGACAPLIGRAQNHFREAAAIMAKCPRRAVRAPRIMAAVYEIILAGIVSRGFAPPRPRIRVPRARLLWILVSHAIV